MEEAVNILYHMVSRAGRKMECRGEVYKEFGNWYNVECQQKKEKKGIKAALKEYKYRVDDKFRGRYWECRKEKVHRN
jgi:hypothetical protein